jgi:hypothetical protein
MRDRSASYWFNVGDAVQVVESVIKGGIGDLKGSTGKVISTWSKCEVDPTCCCAEQVDRDMAVQVEFFGTASSSSSSFTHYFAEDELTAVVDTYSAEKEEEVEQEKEPIKLMNVKDDSSSSGVAFDGMSCKAFKLDQLKMGTQARRLAAFEASRTAELEEQ